MKKDDTHIHKDLDASQRVLLLFLLGLLAIFSQVTPLKVTATAKTCSSRRRRGTPEGVESTGLLLLRPSPSLLLVTAAMKFSLPFLFLALS